MSDWQFDTIRSGTTEGWFSGGLSSFRDRLIRNLVREILQNSLDNPAEKDQSAPIRVRFSDCKIVREKVPGIDNLQEHLAKCEKATTARSAKEHRQEVKDALLYAKRDDFRTLIVEDFNTSGMKGGTHGPCEEGSEFFNYIKTEGESGGSQNRGGSHGLGKNAPLINSRIRAIFASTCWKENGKMKSLLQGRCQLTTRNTENPPEKFVPRGYWGDSDFNPLTEIPEKFDWLSRNGEQGTTIAVLGWMPPDRWEALIIGYAITSFFAAFARGKLVLEVGDKYTINQGTVLEHLNNNTIKQRLDEDDPVNAGSEWDLAKAFYDCLSEDENVITETFQCTSKIGKGTLRLKVFEGAPSKIAFIRSNILITENIPNFYKNKPGQTNEFVGVYECENADGLQLLRGMEPPQHNDLKPDFLPEEQRQDGKRGLKNLGEKLKELVKTHAGHDVDKSAPDKITLEFFADEAGDGDDDFDDDDFDDDEDSNPEGMLVIKMKPRQLPKPKKIPSERDMQEEEDKISDEIDGEEGGSGEGVGGSGTGSGHGTGEGAGTGGSGTRGIEKEIRDEAIAISSERFIKTAPNTGRVKFNVSVSRKNAVEICLFEVGADTISYIPVAEIFSSSEELGNKGIKMQPADGGKIDFEFQLSRPLLGGLKLVVNEVNENAV